jgi:hypothetical protein
LQVTGQYFTILKFGVGLDATELAGYVCSPAGLQLGAKQFMKWHTLLKLSILVSSRQLLNYTVVVILMCVGLGLENCVVFISIFSYF